MDLVIVGHLAFNEDRTPVGTRVSIGGAAYYCAVGASVGDPRRVGVVAQVGRDFDLAPLADRGFNLQGVSTRTPGRTARFIITQCPDGTRLFDADWGVSRCVDVDTYPEDYAEARCVHLATAPPQQQLRWLLYLRQRQPSATVSVDTFESFAKRFPRATRRVVQLADTVFMNREEAELLYIEGPAKPDQTLVIKEGPHGARLLCDREEVKVPAPVVRAVETTGAGDILAGAFLALVAAGTECAQALREAVTVASASVRDFGVDHSFVEVALQQTRREPYHKRAGQETGAQSEEKRQRESLVTTNFKHYTAN